MSTGYKAMSVPDTIQLSESGLDYRQSQYKPTYMKVPDKITLDSTEGRGVAVNEVVPPTSSVPEDQLISVANPVKGGPPLPLVTTASDVRLDSIEQRLQAVEEKLSSTRLSSGPSNFWYALTFSTWVMVPLIVVYLVYYKRHT